MRILRAAVTRRARRRAAAHAFLLVTAAGLVALGLVGGYTVEGLPAHWVGVLLAAFWAAGLLGVNVWAGGPLDPRNDPPEDRPPPPRWFSSPRKD